MRPRVSVFIATSLDGFIAREDGRIDWLMNANATFPPGEDCGYGAFAATVDALVMGRRTFEQVLEFDPWPYEGKRLVVLSRGNVPVPEALRATVSGTSEAPHALLERLGAEGVQHVYLDGGLAIQSFLAEGLVDELTITRIPVLLGVGKPLFGPLPADVPLEHVATTAYPFGVVQSRYRALSASPRM